MSSTVLTLYFLYQDKEGSRPDLLATTGEFLRIWQVGEEGVTLERLLNNVRGGMACWRR